ncbi:hypothetical protein LguiA_022956 [Lonicera macranthoides]
MIENPPRANHDHYPSQWVQSPPQVIGSHRIIAHDHHDYYLQIVVLLVMT